MIILAIETSCDDTCISIIKSKNKGIKFEILSNVISSQVKLHAKYGGVYPSLAKREHQKNLPIALKKAEKIAGVLRFDLIAVTAGPGLEPCLWTGVNFAKELADKLKLPIIPVNHIEAHMLANWLLPINKNPKNIFPAICLVVSGGHTCLILMRNIGKYKLIGETRDDAAGECFDKAARVLGLGYPGGPVIAEQARRWKSKIPSPDGQIRLPRPMINQKNYDFSFSGLKTAILYDFQNHSSSTRNAQKYIREMCFETQQAIIDVLIKKTIKAAKDFNAKTVILGGGVTANNELRKQFKSQIKNSKLKIQFLVPPKIFCTDNAAMVGVAAFFRQQRNKSLKILQAITVNANLKI